VSGARGIYGLAALQSTLKLLSLVVTLWKVTPTTLGVSHPLDWAQKTPQYATPATIKVTPPDLPTHFD